MDSKGLAKTHGKAVKLLLILGERTGWKDVLTRSVYSRARLAAHYGREALGE